jgi:trans-aconitate 2-methyltransferase
MTYQWNSEEYAKNSAAQFEWARELIAKLRLVGNESALDIGCGDGKVTNLLAECVPHGRVTGIDSSPDMIALADRSFPQRNLKFVEMDARTITFQNSFDVVFSNAALHWVKNHRAILRGVKQCLKAGGRLLFQMGGRGNAQDILAVFDELFTQDRWKPYFTDFEFPYGFYGPEEYKAWLAEAGLTAARVELIPKDMAQPDRDHLAGWIRTTWLPYTQRLPAELREPFIAAVIETYLRDHSANANGTIHVKMVRLEVEATNP